MLGILGMGGNGRNLPRKMRAFGMQVVYHNRKRLSDEDEDGARYVGFDELLRSSDVVSLNLPLNERTRGLVGERELKRMKRGVVIVNTARGAVVDEDALVKALQEGKVGCVGLDVFEEEPAVHEGLRRDERVLLLPHMGTWTVEVSLFLFVIFLGTCQGSGRFGDCRKEKKKGEVVWRGAVVPGEFVLTRLIL